MGENVSSAPFVLHEVLVVVPTYNEASNILKLIDQVADAVVGVHLLVVDDGSPDGTADVVRSHPSYGSELHVLARTGERGLGNAYREGFAWAARRGYSAVVQMDADLSHPAERIPALLEALTGIDGADGADVVIGSRYVAGGGSVGWPWRRRMISRCAGTYARLMLGLHAHDPTAGFKAYRIEALAEIDVASTTTTGYGFQVECLWRAVQRDLRVVEVPITFTDRVAGSSKMSLGVAVEAARRILGWRLASEGERWLRWVALACLLTLGIHMLYLRGPLLADEGGFAMVARWWGHGGDQLYGPQWVDRPPALIGVFWLADLLGNAGVRLMAGIVAAAFVLAAAWAGWVVRGRRGAVWAGWTGFFLMSTPFTQAFALNGELIAATWSMIAIAAGLHAVRGQPGRPATLALAVIAGAGASMAMLTKQNFVEALAFLVVLLVAQAVYAPACRRRLLAASAAVGIGVVIPLATAAAWAHAHGDLGGLLYAMYGFRIDARGVMAAWSGVAPGKRLHTLPLLALASGILTLGLALGIAVGIEGRRRLWRPSPLVIATAVAGLIELTGILLGGNYWAHYLIGLAPVLAFAAGALASQSSPSPQSVRGTRLVRVFIVLPVLATLAISPAAAERVTELNTVEATAGWLAGAAAEDDTLVVLYSHANLIQASGLRPAYPYAWSLPIRTLDPRLDLLVATLDSPSTAPTWVVGWDGLHTWGLDPDRHIDDALAAHYVQVASICGHPVWLRRGLDRPLPSPACTHATRPATHPATIGDSTHE
ncbi:MAG: glycosyltransferase [Nocardioides sp.]|uniref:glycosyltransferase n=1 Tax=Nocardioides sp. TaxID=35761 RepID=UPI0039E277ED